MLNNFKDLISNQSRTNLQSVVRLGHRIYTQALQRIETKSVEVGFDLSERILDHVFRADLRDCNFNRI